MSRDEVQFKYFYNWVSGELAGSTVALQLPTVTSEEIWIKASAANTGNVYISGSSNVTIADGSSDSTTGIQLDAGDLLGPLRTNNLNKFWRITDNSSDNLTYLVSA